MEPLSVEELPKPVRLAALAVAELVERADLQAARRLLGRIDEAGLWAEHQAALKAYRGVPGATTLPRHDIPRDAALAVHRRNFFTCRYDRCGFTPTVGEDVLKVLGRLGVFAYYRPDKTPRWHPLAWTYMAAPEHLVPRSPNPSDWTTACWTCNSAKSDRTVEALGWHWDPEPPARPWCGLTEHLPTLENLAARLGAPTSLSMRPRRTAEPMATPAGPSKRRGSVRAGPELGDLDDPAWSVVAHERSSVDAAAYIADAEGLPASSPLRVGKPSRIYGGRRGASVPPLRTAAPQIYGYAGRWRLFNASKHAWSEGVSSSAPWVVQRRNEASDPTERP